MELGVRRLEGDAGRIEGWEGLEGTWSRIWEDARTCVRLWGGWGNIKGYCGVKREGVQKDFCET